ncbi:Bug family tripartite tricarboxylate transporter substrate binding protein [Paracandidimonas soli]|uniref:Tripartite-type tricarboxylate transporter receptor subunit TctC n=2 Tax=Paracandidimonas soli TaxID=1917182 RepID=A0A4R3ULN0_9BURK|nr:tripartite tricarboxylate transporter substrate binding protein [Paracandidimonas soli]TCU92596.1 tripartite-type tricarboxylate transporter receptor subunit TctC [Paracandidimonas soli]
MAYRYAKGAFLAAALLLGGASAASSLGQGAVTFIAPYPPGGGTDTLTRMLANTITSQTGWNIVVENKPGAGGNLALDTTARAKPDGHTLVMAQTDNIALNPWLYRKLSYDTFKDFTPIGLVASSPSVYVVAPSSPFNTLADIVMAAKEKPGVITLGIPGVGGTGDLLGHLFGKAAGIELSHVPYRGWSQAFPDLSSGRIDIYTGSVASLLPHILSKDVKPIAVIGEARSPALPDIPTFAESGYADVKQAIWWGLAGPAGIPEDVVAELNKAMRDAVASAEMTERLKQAGYAPIGSSAADMAERQKEDTDLFGGLVKESGIEPQ